MSDTTSKTPPRRLFPNFHAIVSAELAAYFATKSKAIEAEAGVREVARKLKLLGVDPEWRISEALNADPEQVFVCGHEGCDRPVISQSWAPRDFCDEHTPPAKPEPEPAVKATEAA